MKLCTIITLHVKKYMYVVVHIPEKVLDIQSVWILIDDDALIPGIKLLFTNRLLFFDIMHFVCLNIVY